MIEAYLHAFVNEKHNNLAKLLPMAKFAYNNIKNTSTIYTPFELNYNHHLCVFFENKADSCLRFRFTNKQAKELRKLISICEHHLLHALELQKQAHNKEVKPYSYALGEKV